MYLFLYYFKPFIFIKTKNVKNQVILVSHYTCRFIWIYMSHLWDIENIIFWHNNLVNKFTLTL
jgi:hypothetical protein